ncbi:hypothetical protein BC834DRAFT_878302 [Gloeopeniophorella convolvens]|nr:hypothetical protein BC834DRAFT_878302 [Gloeopeniophorella convolvens]
MNKRRWICHVPWIPSDVLSSCNETTGSSALIQDSVLATDCVVRCRANVLSARWPPAGSCGLAFLRKEWC